jgi:hypothetical protein
VLGDRHGREAATRDVMLPPIGMLGETADQAAGLARLVRRVPVRLDRRDVFGRVALDERRRVPEGK